MVAEASGDEAEYAREMIAVNRGELLGLPAGGGAIDRIYAHEIARSGHRCCPR
jgi:hypothetical protein